MIWAKEVLYIDTPEISRVYVLYEYKLQIRTHLNCLSWQHKKKKQKKTWSNEDIFGSFTSHFIRYEQLMLQSVSTVLN